MCPQAARRRRRRPRGRRAAGHRQPQDERPGLRGAALAAAVPLPRPAAGRPVLPERRQVGRGWGAARGAVRGAEGRPCTRAARPAPFNFPGRAPGRRSLGWAGGEHFPRRGREEGPGSSVLGSLPGDRFRFRGRPPRSCPRPPAPLTALLVLGTSQGRMRSVAEPRSLPEGWRPPDAGCGHLLLIGGQCPSGSCCGRLLRAATSPYLAFFWADESKINLSLSAKDHQNELSGVIHVLGGLAGSWRRCCFSLPFPQIAVLVNTQHFSSVSHQGGALRPQGKARAGACGAWDQNRFPCGVMGRGRGLVSARLPPHPTRTCVLASPSHSAMTQVST